MLNRLLDLLGQVPPPAVYGIVAGLAFAEAALFVGFVLPGETAVVLGGVIASQHRVSLPVLLVLVPVAAIAGDSVGYEVGRQLGPRVLNSRPLRRHRGRLRRAQDLLARRGGAAVLIGRFTAFLRAVTPGLAGAARMPYPRFLLYNAAGGVTWGIGFTLLGYFAGASYRTVERVAGEVSAGLLALVVLAALVAWHWQRRRAEPAVDDAEPPEGLEGSAR